MVGHLFFLLFTTIKIYQFSVFAVFWYILYHFTWFLLKMV